MSGGLFIIMRIFLLPVLMIFGFVARWIGGHPEHTDIQEVIREVKTGFDSTVGRDQALMNRRKTNLAVFITNFCDIQQEDN